MAIVLALQCDRCGRVCSWQNGVAAWRVWCPHCERYLDFAPWSYQQLIGWIGLEAAYQLDKLALIAQNHTIVTREQWAILTRVLVFTHGQLIQLLQAGIVPKRELGLGAELSAGGNRNGGGLHLGRDHRFRNAT